MPTPRDFLQTSDGDVDFSKGLRFTQDLATYTAQKLSQTLNFWEGEWFLDLRLGIPYLRVVGKRPDLPLLESLLRQAALKTRGVGSVRSVSVEFDARTRVAGAYLDCQTIEGEDVPAPGPLILDLR